MDYDDARRATFERRRETRRLAVDPKVALIRRKFSRQHVDQGGLAGAILAHDRVHLSAAKSHGDAIKRDDAGEPFGDPGDLDDVVVAIRHGAPRDGPRRARTVAAARYFLATSAMLSLV